MGNPLLWNTTGGWESLRDLTLTLPAGFSHLYHVDSFNSRKPKEVHDRVMEDTNVSPGSQFLTQVHNRQVNICEDAYVWPNSSQWDFTAVAMQPEKAQVWSSSWWSFCCFVMWQMVLVYCWRHNTYFCHTVECFVSMLSPLKKIQFQFFMQLKLILISLIQFQFAFKTDILTFLAFSFLAHLWDEMMNLIFCPKQPIQRTSIGSPSLFGSQLTRADRCINDDRFQTQGIWRTITPRLPCQWLTSWPVSGHTAMEIYKQIWRQEWPVESVTGQWVWESVCWANTLRHTSHTQLGNNSIEDLLSNWTMSNRGAKRYANLFKT